MTPEQLALRKRYIGASEAAASVGASPWQTPYQLWEQKVSDVEQPDTPAMEWGRRLEQVILNRYLEDLQPPPPEVLLQPHIVSTDFPWMAATPDALLPGDRVIEVKTAGWGQAEQWGEPGTDEVPLPYYLQTHHQMVCAGVRLADVPTLFGGRDYRVYRVPYNADVADMLIAREREFWNFVETRQPPDIKTVADAISRWPTDTGEIVVATPEIMNTVLKLCELDDEIKTREADRERLQVTVRDFMKDASVLTDAGGTQLATWKAHNQSKFEFKTFKAEHPELYAQFSTNQPIRKFLLSRSKAK